MDDVDMSAEKQERLELAKLRNIREQADKQEVPRSKNGTCLWCEEKIEVPKRWCSADCRDQWQRFAPK